MPIRKRPAAKKQTTKQRENLIEQLHGLAIQLAAYRSRLNDALSLLEGVDCFRNVHLQIAEVLASLEESAVWFSDYFEEHIDPDALVTNLQIYGAEALFDQMNYLGTPDPDDEDLDWTPADLEDDPVADSPPHREAYPPGMAASILDQDPEEDEGDHMGSYSCTVKLLGLKKDVALISERLIDQIKVAGFELHDEIRRLDH